MSLHFHEKITADSKEYQGIHPLVALDSHQSSLSKLINKSLRFLPNAPNDSDFAGSIILQSSDGNPIWRRKPDFISVTRGPGMRSNLATGLDTAKGLSVAWQIPLVGVHHMQGHLLTPRLESAMKIKTNNASQKISPEFPFLSILVSGGHTMLVNSKSLDKHTILAATIDIAMGDAIDKTARLVLPPSLLASTEATMYGKSMEAFAFPGGKDDHSFYEPPSTRHAEIAKRKSGDYDWEFNLPLSNTRKLEFSFAGIPSRVKRIFNERKAAFPTDATTEDIMSYNERVALARMVMQICFEHLASRTVIALDDLKARGECPPTTLVVSGGVAANQFLWTVLRRFLDARGYSDIELIAPKPALCTDNAAMIAWAGLEMFESGVQSDLSCLALRKWSLDPDAEDGGIMGVGGWIKS